MQVQFREFDPFDLWFWLEFKNVPASGEIQYIEELFNSWFYLGKLGGFNAENIQIQETGIDISYFDYDQNNLEEAMMSPMHNMGEIEILGNWGRIWFDLGTSDLIGLDILINSLFQLSKEYVEIKTLIIGGQNDDWPIDNESGAISF
jgi:hypothetical protein